MRTVDRSNLLIVGIIYLQKIGIFVHTDIPLRWRASHTVASSYRKTHPVISITASFRKRVFPEIIDSLQCVWIQPGKCAVRMIIIIVFGDNFIPGPRYISDDRKRGIYSVLPAVFRGQLLRRTDEGIYRCGDHSPGQIIDDVINILMNKVNEKRDQDQRGMSGRDECRENSCI